MADFYDKLGDLLNDVLENGKIPEKQNNTPQNNERSESDTKKSSQSNENQSKNYENTINESKISEKIRKNQTKVPVGQVIKMHKYTKIMHIPDNILQILTTLDVAYPYKWKDIVKRYHQLLKELHPDTKRNQNTIQNSQIVYNNRQLDINTLQGMYKILDSYFNDN